MFRLGLALAVAGVLSAFGVHAAPLEVYGKLPNIEAVALSPNGTTLAVIATDGDERTIIIKDIVKGKILARLRGGNLKLRALDWAGDDHLIFTLTRTAFIDGVIAPREEWALVSDYSLKTGKIRPMLSRVADSLNVAVSAPRVRIINGKPLVFIAGIQFVGGVGVQALYRVDPETDVNRTIAVGVRDTRAWEVAPDGTPMAQTLYDDKTGRWTLKMRVGETWRESRVIGKSDNYPEVLGLGRDGRSLLVSELRDGVTALREVSPDGVWGQALPLQDADEPIFDPASHKLIGYYALVGNEGRYTFFDAQDQKVWDAVAKAFPGEIVHLQSWSSDRGKFVVLVDSPTEGPGYALVDLATRKAAWIDSEYESLTTADIAPVRPVGFKAADGMELSGYLTTPRGAEAKNLPLVVFPHGGPAVRDEPGFNWWAQAMASRGYAVLQVNYRGSDGYGWNFLKAGFGQWGRKMQTDLSDGVRYLAGQGVIDPKRVCIVGGSYGGYAALAGVTLDPGVYRCAVSYAGISDLKRFAPWLRSNKSLSSERYFDRFIGAENTRDPSMLEVSPVAHVDRVTAPVLLIHGKDDTVVPLEQSRFMADALKAAGKPVEFVSLNSTDHWLTKGETRLSMLQATIAFLEKNNPPH